MVSKIQIRNFRSIREQSVTIAPLSVIYGPNGAGKSSLLHAAIVLRNIVMNPTQPVDSFFSIPGLATFGGFQQVVHKHRADAQIELELELGDLLGGLSYGVRLGKVQGGFLLKSTTPPISMQVSTAFPYAANAQETINVETPSGGFNITWNGILAQVRPQAPQPELTEEANSLAAGLNQPIEQLRRMDLVHVKRGFFKPHYGAVSLATFHGEDEVATLLASDVYLTGKVSAYLETILGRDFRTHTAPGTAVTSLVTTEKPSGLVTELVNDGFGVNQIVYLLSKCLRTDVETVFIEEPEINLHPKALRELARALIRITQDEGKTLVISTHSESLVLSLLTAVATKQLNVSNLALYLCEKRKGETQFDRQEVKGNGQVEGGLANFIEGELEDIQEFLKVRKL